MLWLAAAAMAATVDRKDAVDFSPDPRPIAAEALDRFRHDAYWVVDAWIARKVEGSGPTRTVSWAVFYDEPPTSPGVDIEREEWVVVDGTGRLLTGPQLSVLSGHLGSGGPRFRTPYLGGAQDDYDRDEVARWSAERNAGARERVGLDPEDEAAVRAEVIASLGSGVWTPEMPEPID
jgi:hypothetical protein